MNILIFILAIIFGAFLQIFLNTKNFIFLIIGILCAAFLMISIIFKKKKLEKKAQELKRLDDNFMMSIDEMLLARNNTIIKTIPLFCISIGFFIGIVHIEDSINVREMNLPLVLVTPFIAFLISLLILMVRHILLKMRDIDGMYKKVFFYLSNGNIDQYRYRIDTEIRQRNLLYSDRKKNRLYPTALISFDNRAFGGFFATPLVICPCDKILWAVPHKIEEGIYGIPLITIHMLFIYMAGNKRPVQIAFKHEQLMYEMIDALEKHYNIYGGKNDELERLRKKDYNEFEQYCQHYKNRLSGVPNIF